MVLSSKNGDVFVYAATIEQEAVAQIQTMADSPLGENANIRIMPDAHAGTGCVIGTTMKITDKICPNLVGVDIGCLDKDTEVLTPNGWIKISEYENQDILIYNKDTDMAYFNTPLAYIKKKCNEFYHFYSKKGLNQMLSEEHKMLIWKGRKSRGYTKHIAFAKDVFENHNKALNNSMAIKTTFNFKNKGIDLSDDMIRVLVMISADGRIRSNKSNTITHVELHFKKERKINRAVDLLKKADISFKMYKIKDKSTYITFNLDSIISKNLSIFYHANREQLAVLIDEVYHWDGTIDEKRNHKNFSSIEKTNADVVQFALASNGIRAGIYVKDYPNKENWRTNYTVYQAQNEYVGFPNNKFKKVKSLDGYKYCFTTETGFFVIRRNNCISITGNCGVNLVKTSLNFSKLYNELDNIIRTYIPYGMNVQEEEFLYYSFDNLRCWNKLPKSVQNRAERSMGTLGGGNHFIEAYERGYLSVHSGSRSIGLAVAKYYQNLAEQRIKEYNHKLIKEQLQQILPIEREKWLKENNTISIDKNLCYLTGEDMQDYLHDIEILQDFASNNRFAIISTIVSKLNGGIDMSDCISSTHNYIDTKNMILRKGAISAQKDEILVIPLNMRDGVLICKGKGNEDWNYSAPHGAGRLYSRSKAKETFTVDEYAKSMDGIYSTCISEATLDEAPFVYKDYEEIIKCITPTVDIIRRIVPIYNFKADN